MEDELKKSIELIKDLYNDMLSIADDNPDLYIMPKGLYERIMKKLGHMEDRIKSQTNSLKVHLKDKQELSKLTKLFAEGYNSIFAATTPHVEIVKDDPDDNKFIECAVELESKIIISGDKHLKEIKKYIDVEIMSPREFIDRFKMQ